MIYIIYAVIAVLIVIADYVTKAMVVSSMELGESIPLWDGVFQFTYIQNRGAAFGMLSDARWVFLILSTVAIIGIIGYVAWKRPKSKLVLTALSLIVGGGIGNMIDRVKLGYVVDFLDFCALPNLWKWIFNVADACAVIGACLLILYLVIDIIKTDKAEKAAALSKKDETADTDSEDKND